MTKGRGPAYGEAVRSPDGPNGTEPRRRGRRETGPERRRVRTYRLTNGGGALRKGLVVGVKSSRTEYVNNSVKGENRRRSVNKDTFNGSNKIHEKSQIPKREERPCSRGTPVPRTCDRAPTSGTHPGNHPWGSTTQGSGLVTNRSDRVSVDLALLHP